MGEACSMHGRDDCVHLTQNMGGGVYSNESLGSKRVGTVLTN
jgi:hypothetical protein